MILLVKMINKDLDELEFEIEGVIMRYVAECKLLGYNANCIEARLSDLIFDSSGGDLILTVAR